MSGGRVLIAGIGNVFLGDDGFGVEVVRRLDPVSLPDVVDVVEYGIRGIHLAYELLDGRYSTLVMVDAVPLEEPPGTLAVLEVPPGDRDRGTDSDRAEWSEDPLRLVPVDGHGMSPAAVIDLMRTLGGSVERVLVVGCRPAVIEECMGLSPVVQAAVGTAVRLVTDLATELVAPSPSRDRLSEEDPVEVA